MFDQGVGDRGPGDVTQFGEPVKAVRTGIDLVVLELIGGRMSVSGVLAV